MTNDDRFDEALRRKLEEVNPAYQEKNWTQLQRFMSSRGFPPSIWHTPATWLPAALTTAAAASMLLVVVWQYRTHQTLIAQIRTLTSTVARLERTQSNSQPNGTPFRIDTVYVVQRAAPEPGTFHRPETQPDFTPGQSAATVDAPRTAPNRLTGSTSAPSTARNNRAANVPDARARTPATRQPAQVEAGSSAVEKAPRVAASQLENLLAARTQPGRRPGASPGQATDQQRMTPNPPDAPVATAAPVQLTQSGGSGTSAARPMTTTAPNEALATLQPAQPISTLSQPATWTDQWQWRVRRVGYRSPFGPTAPAADLSAVAPAQRSNPAATQFRLGVGGELTTAQRSLGVSGELLINNHLMISAGLGQATWSGVVYPSEIQFSNHIKRDFRKEYMNDKPDPGPSAPGGPITRPRQAFDITWSGAALVVPVQVGYRLDVGRRLAISPFVGMNLSLNPTETLDFSYEDLMPRSAQRINIRKEQPTRLYSSWTIGFGLERPVGPFMAQLSPLVTLPLAPRDNTLNNTSVGLRARLYYQF